MPKKRDRKPQPTQKRSVPVWVWGIIGLVIVIGVGTAIIVSTANKLPDPAPPGAFSLGPVTYCRIVPPFAASLGFDETSIIDTQGSAKGLIIYNPNADGSLPTDVYQDPTWDDVGYLGPVTTDQSGNIFTGPVPRISLFDNPPELQNTLYKVDATTGKLSAYLTLPATSTADMPYGILGLAYDCDTNSLYVSSVAGSTRTTEHGVIYHIDMDTGEIVSTFKDVDAFGLVVFNGVSGKRLYFGSARLSEVRSVALSVKGDFAGVSRREFSMVGWGTEGDDRARRLVVDVSSRMTVRGTPFEYNLIATSERANSEYVLQYDNASDTWKPVAYYGG